MDRIPVNCWPRSVVTSLAFLVILVTVPTSQADQGMMPTLGHPPACVASQHEQHDSRGVTDTAAVGQPANVVSGHGQTFESELAVSKPVLLSLLHCLSQAIEPSLSRVDQCRHVYSLSLYTEGDDARRIVQYDGQQVRFLRDETSGIFHSETKSDGYIVAEVNGGHRWYLPDSAQLGFQDATLTRLEIDLSDSHRLYYERDRLASVGDFPDRQWQFEETSHARELLFQRWEKGQTLSARSNSLLPPNCPFISTSSR